ncbi:hypothetical protein ACKUFS_04705 [Pseudomonas cannabina]|uniref:hypothetical protein n=1 Tax=Pseudomonas syringae group TaxID=136849 RepID=UPI001CE047EB|nr:MULTISPECIES: hypothetical protein [Pseudomonas syringae group]UBY98708.1 hypothetical protein LCG56_06180 [Pseudomonas cannabina pv. alisalensis]
MSWRVGRRGQASQAWLSIIEAQSRPESANVPFVYLLEINIFVSHWHFNVDLAVSYSSFDYQAH